MTLTQTTILQRSENASYEVVAGEAILIDVQTGTYFSLNKIGTEFWEMIDGTQSILQQATTIANRYNVDVPMVAADDYAQQSTPPQLIKLDVEGAETFVLQGANRLLASANPPTLLIEMHPAQIIALGSDQADHAPRPIVQCHEAAHR